MSEIPQGAVSAISNIVNLLIEGRYEEIEQITSHNKLSAEEIQRAVDDYGQKLVLPPPTETPRNINAIKIISDTKNSWSINYSLWTEEEGRSDLTLETTITLDEHDEPKIQIDNIHIL